MVSSLYWRIFPQVDNAQRGFSYMHDAPLDMRMNTEADFSAYDLVNSYDEDALERVLREFGEEKCLAASPGSS